MRQFCFLLSFLLAAFTLIAQNQPPTVAIQDISVDEAAQSLILTFDLDDAEGEGQKRQLLHENWFRK